VAVCRVSAPAVVLGSTQTLAVVDAQRAASQGVSVARRRSGGGAVLVTPGDPVWVDVWVPAGDPLWTEDVGRGFDWMGDAWVAALGRSGVTGVSAHRGGSVARTPWSTLVCFGGVGTGEVVTGDGRKVVGLAQRRNRDGAWFHGACILRWDPRRLVGLLALSDSERAAAEEALGAASVGVGDLLHRDGGRAVAASEIAASLVASLP
jgi:lipoate-protein ligase A